MGFDRSLWILYGDSHSTFSIPEVALLGLGAGSAPRQDGSQRAGGRSEGVSSPLRRPGPIWKLIQSYASTGSIKERAEQMHAYLSSTLPKGTGVNFVAHSMGGLDARYLISNIKPDNYKPVSLTTIATPHRGSPFMDWCAANIGVGTPPAAAAATMAAASLATDAAKALPFSLKSPLLARTQEEAAKDVGRMVGFTTALTKYLLNIFDSPAYGNLTTSFLRDEFNPEVPDSSDVKYISVAGRLPKISVFHPLWFPKLVLDAAAEKGYAEDGGKSGKEYEGNDGLVSVSSAKWGDFLGVVDGTHHWDLRGEGGIWPNGAGIDNGKESQAASDKAKSNEEDRVESELMPGGWGWNEGYEEYLGLKDKVVDKIVPDALSNALSTSPSSSSSPSSSTTTKPSNPENNAKSKSDSSSWDVAQLGQVVEWVTDLIPGGKSSETSKAQIEEVKRESQDKSRARAKEKERQEKKAKEFDLARFYGGLMLKLREDGF